MTEEPNKEEQKVVEKKNEILHLDIDVQNLFKEISNITVPDNQKVWDGPQDMSPEYKALNHSLQILAVFLAHECNTGPEVKDNVNKRLILARGILGVFLDNLQVTGYDCYGMLSEIHQDLYMRINGTKYVLNCMSQVAAAQEAMKKKIATEQSSKYTS